MRFTGAVHQPRVLALRGPPLQGRVQTFFHEAPTYPFDGGRAHIQGCGNRFIGPGRTMGAFIGLQQNAGMGQGTGRRLASIDQTFEFRPLLLRERDVILLARWGWRAHQRPPG